MEQISGEKSNLKWTTIVVTCASKSVRDGVEEECKRLSCGGLLPPHDNLLVVADPQCQAQQTQAAPGVGSGGATINAILIAIERLSAHQNCTTINSELVHHSRLLVVHLGRLLPHCPGGSAFLRLAPDRTLVPSAATITPPTLLQHTIWMATRIAEKSRYGVWVTSLDALMMPACTALEPASTEGVEGAVVCTVQAPLQYATHHGIVVGLENKEISKLHYRLPVEDMRQELGGERASLIAGVVFLSACLTERLLGLHITPPLDRCTYHGTDSGVTPLQISLYFDLLLPLCAGTKYEEYTSGQCGTAYASAASYSCHTQQEAQAARIQIWKQLQGFRATHHPLDLQHHYLGSSLPFDRLILPFFPSKSLCYGDPASGGQDTEKIITVNSIISENITTEEKIWILDSWIGKDFSLTTKGNCVVMGLQLQDFEGSVNLPGQCVYQQHPGHNYDVITSYGVSDDLSQPHHCPTATIFNTQWSVFLARSGIKEEDIWNECAEGSQNQLTAKLFCTDVPLVIQLKMIVLLVSALDDDWCQQEWLMKLPEWKKRHRVSVLEAAKGCDLRRLMQDRQKVYLGTVNKFIGDTAGQVGGKSLLPLFAYIVTRGQGAMRAVQQSLHQQLHQARASTPRLLANVADLLGCLAGGQGGLRSGPAANPEWTPAFQHLRAGQQGRAMEEMWRICQDWTATGRPEDLIRAARHYERAYQVVISQLVETAGTHVASMWVGRELRSRLAAGVWVEAHSPARLDLAGGWTDTPPICYEQGGAVLNVAIKVNKKKPIGCRVRFVEELQVVCVLRDWSGADLRLTWTNLQQLTDYNNPISPGALVKAVLLYCQLVDLNSDHSLSSQLQERYGHGVEVELWSCLPQGSGLGGSSLLAGTLVAALVVLLGHPPPRHSHLLHATLCIEQWLTTGGGWQDQVGGLIGGVKLGLSGAGTPVTVASYRIPLTSQFVALLNQHLLLLYTDKVRLARNLLQTVIRNWYARDPTITSCFALLHRLAVKAAGAVLHQDLTLLGSCIGEYWNLKKMVASGCEPSKVTRIMCALEPHCLGMALAGAGGGGYLYALKSLPEPLKAGVLPVGLEGDEVEVDQDGLELWVAGESVPLSTDEGEAFLTQQKLQELQQSVNV